MPEAKHYSEGQQRKEDDGIAAQKPAQLCERGWRFEHSLRNVNVDGEAAAHGKRVGGFESSVGTLDFSGRFAFFGTVGAGEGLSAQSSGAIFGQGHEGGGMIDGNGPIVAGYVPVELIVTIEEADAIADGVIDVDYARRVDCAGNVDLEIAIVPRLARIVLQFVSGFVSYAQDIDKQRVVGSLRPGILDGNGAVNAVPRADKRQGDFFADQGPAITGDRDRVREIGDTPVAGLGSGIDSEREQQE